MFSRDEMQRAIEDALKSMEGVALELYRRGREPLLAELEEARRLVDQLGTARDKAEAELRELQRSTNEALAQAVEWQRERDDARAEVERLRAEAAPMNEHFAAGYRDGARDAYRRGAEAMREACARWMSEREGIAQWVYDDALSALPIPEEP